MGLRVVPIDYLIAAHLWRMAIYRIESIIAHQSYIYIYIDIYIYIYRIEFIIPVSHGCEVGGRVHESAVRFSISTSTSI